MAREYYATCKVPYTQTITIGALVRTNLRTGEETEIAPAKTLVFARSVGDVMKFPTQKRCKEFIQERNANHPGTWEMENYATKC